MPLLVAAAALTDLSGRVLVQRRPPGKPLPDLWEFPGGKLEAGETPEAALVRELAEELGITVAPADLEPLGFASHPHPAGHLVMLLYRCARWEGTPEGCQNQLLRWEPPEALRALPMPPADAPLVGMLAG